MLYEVYKETVVCITTGQSHASNQAIELLNAFTSQINLSILN